MRFPRTVIAYFLLILFYIVYLIRPQKSILLFWCWCFCSTFSKLIVAVQHYFPENLVTKTKVLKNDYFVKHCRNYFHLKLFDDLRIAGSDLAKNIQMNQC